MGRNSYIAPPPKTAEEYAQFEMQRAKDSDVSSIYKALQVEGWMDVDELLWLAEQAKSHHRIVELGSYLGRSTRALADNTPGWVAAVDDWWGPREIDLPNRYLLFPNFKANTQDLIDSGKIKIFRTNHSFPPSGLNPDMVFIDGEHGYDSALADIQFWRREIQNGLLCGHDADLLTVQQAVMDAFGDLDVVPETKIWIREIP